MDYQLSQLLQQTLLIYPYVSTDFHNDFTWSSIATSVKARIQSVAKIVRNKQGQEMYSTCTIYVDNTVTVSERDKIVLPNGVIPEILAINSEPDETGANYYTAIYTRV